MGINCLLSYMLAFCNGKLYARTASHLPWHRSNAIVGSTVSIQHILKTLRGLLNVVQIVQDSQMLGLFSLHASLHNFFFFFVII